MRRFIGEFERALNNEEFVMYLQPQVDFKGIARGAEALVRWRHPVKGLLSPAVFVDVLEKGKSDFVKEKLSILGEKYDSASAILYFKSQK